MSFEDLVGDAAYDAGDVVAGHYLRQGVSFPASLDRPLKVRRPP
jgi:hypothetical protein